MSRRGGYKDYGLHRVTEGTEKGQRKYGVMATMVVLFMAVVNAFVTISLK